MESGGNNYIDTSWKRNAQEFDQTEETYAFENKAYLGWTVV